MTLRYYLPDTNVFSELDRPSPEPEVFWWFQHHPLELIFLSAIVLGEMRRGVVNNPPGHPARVRRERTLQELESAYAGRILPVDGEVAKVWGELTVDKSRKRVDTLIAATALVHDLTLVTRDIADFRGIPGLKIHNPWDIPR